MNFFEKHTNTEKIKAELLVSRMNELNVTVRTSGIFSRNYSGDLIDVKKNGPDETVIKLSRDGTFQLLPERLFFEGNRLKSKNKPPAFFRSEHKKLRDEKEKIELFFCPFDTEYFRLTLSFEKKLIELAEKGNVFLTDSFLRECNDSYVGNKYIDKMKTMLPFAGELRGNIKILKDILENVFLSKVEIKTNIFRENWEEFENTKPCIRFMMKFIIHKRGLSKSEYLDMDRDVAVFFDFFYEWFLPVETEYEYGIKDYEEVFTLGNTLILDYNTNL